MEHIYASQSHYEKHATANWCQIMWCPSRNLITRMRRAQTRFDVRWHITHAQGLGEMIWTNAEHEDVAALLDRGEVYRCMNCDVDGRHAEIVGTYNSDAAKARALAAGR